VSWCMQQRPKCSWNYCSTCHVERTRYQNGNKCRVCYDEEHRASRIGSDQKLNPGRHEQPTRVWR
jgi:hypothetical protein